VFVKASVDAGTAEWLRREADLYECIAGPYMCRVLGWDGADLPILVLEDLSDARWPPPWEPGMVEAVLDAVRAVRETVPPEGLPRLESFREEFTCWPLVRDEPEKFLWLGLCSREWLEAALPTLVEAEANAVLTGEALLHLDVRSDNLCVRDGRACLVDWNWACVGNPMVDVAAWLPTLYAEGGPEPESVLPTAPGVPELAAMMAGYWAWNAARSELRPGSLLRTHQKAWLRCALLWAARALGLAAPVEPGE
jgi:hypothetical protein